MRREHPNWRAFIKLGAAAVFVAAAASLYWQWLYPSVTIRYRLAFEVEAGESRRVGSGVIEVAYSKVSQAFGSSRQMAIDVRGEAVAVDLGPHGTMFALLKGGKWARSDPEWIVPNAFGVIGGGFGSDRELPREFARLGALGGSVRLAPGQLPLLVRFRDIADPKTVELVDPDDLAASFGPGVRLLTATLEITSDAVTSGIESRLPWLTAVERRGGALDGARTSYKNDLANILGSRAFRRPGPGWLGVW